ncbi:hypothetical protein KIN20_037324 [Parelaphostrongylus tenuis]|uniref:Uncharacterized protein n=1 Tax=Parelaphostrongylus tenuis TaxID=148309 RepID=A0AAD5RDT6_PARTN|nr:hypothetical protein KIN20_037324 [Parelaphostrongylus tenuis]
MVNYLDQNSITLKEDENLKQQPQQYLESSNTYVEDECDETLSIRLENLMGRQLSTGVK